MQFVKNHLISLAAGVVGLIALAVAALGMMSGAVSEEMKKHVQSASEIESLKGGAQNQTTIDAEKARGDEFKKESDRLAREVDRINKREPLMKGVFPKPDTQAMSVDFKLAYQTAMRRLPIRLNAGAPPNEGEIADEVQNVEELKRAEMEKTVEGGETKESIERALQPPAAAAQPPPPAGGRFSRGGGFPRGEGEELEGLAGGRGGLGRGMMEQTMGYVPSGDPKYDAKFRAIVNKARNILCYAHPEFSFHISPIVKDSQPRAAEMWFAQVGLWIQEDVANAIADLNKTAAAGVKDGDPCVEHTPVKRIESLRVLGYQVKNNLLPFKLASGEAATSGMGSGPDTFRPATFTGQSSNEQFDVVRFMLVAIVDQRKVLDLIDRICKQNFYKCVEVKYELVPAEQGLGDGYMYGTAPCVRVTLNFEGYMARDLYKGLMPPDVLKALSGQQDNP